jgi:Ser/Thr protein kinase RdoA (MazF antagonist)
MMRLSTLWKVLQTFDAAEERSPVADLVAQPWEHDPDTLRLVRASANFVCRFRVGGAEHFIRFADASERNRETIEGEVDLLEWLGRTGMAVIRPVQSRSGNLVETVETNAGIFNAVAFGRLSGSHFSIDDLDHQRFQAWGVALGRLHSRTAEYSGPALAARPTWRVQLDQARAYVAADALPILTELDTIGEALDALPTERNHQGLIHGDFELDNLCWSHEGSDALAILDFDDCTYHWFAADIAFALRDLFDRGVDRSDTRICAFLRGYLEHYPLDDELIAALPLFSRLSRLHVYARLIRSLDLPDRSDQPDWLRCLRIKFEARTSAYRRSLTFGD